MAIRNSLCLSWNRRESDLRRRRLCGKTSPWLSPSRSAGCFRINSVSQTLYDFLPKKESPTTNVLLLDAFLNYISAKGHRTLSRAGKRPSSELFEDKNVILNTPTGSREESLVAAAPVPFQVARARPSLRLHLPESKRLVNGRKRMALCKSLGRRISA